MVCKPALSVFLFLLIFWPHCPIAAGDERPQLVGEVAYSEPLVFDYDQDGKPNKIQLWVSVDVKPALGEKGQPDYRQEGGTLRRYMKDIELGVPAIGYNQFMMLPDNPLGESVDVSDISISGNRATFSSLKMLITVTDNGPGFENDSIVLYDGLREYPVSLFDGDLKIIRGEK